jgi:hypothetical protein
MGGVGVVTRVFLGKPHRNPRYTEARSYRLATTDTAAARTDRMTSSLALMGPSLSLALVLPTS